MRLKHYKGRPLKIVADKFASKYRIILNKKEVAIDKISPRTEISRLTKVLAHRSYPTSERPQSLIIALKRPCHMRNALHFIIGADICGTV